MNTVSSPKPPPINIPTIKRQNTHRGLVPSNEMDSLMRCARIQRLSRDNWIKQSRAWLLLGWVAAERSCPCKQPACPAIGDGSEVTFKPLVPRLSVREDFLTITSPGKMRQYFTIVCQTKFT
ncbi:hypothetical protein J6590_049639 [Homalodisca vitripennis]|nr:hypothetical protein J6590_049639 [Homalodisca vitripennis]